MLTGVLYGFACKLCRVPCLLLSSLLLLTTFWYRPQAVYQQLGSTEKALTKKVGENAQRKYLAQAHEHFAARTGQA